MKNDLQSNTEKPLGSFSEAYEAFHPVVRKKIYAEIIELTDWSKVTFYNKKNGLFDLRLPEKTIVAQVFMKYGVNAWTAEEIIECVNA